MFNIGDKVVLAKGYEEAPAGVTGVVVSAKNDGEIYTIRLDNNAYYGHIAYVGTFSADFLACNGWDCHAPMYYCVAEKCLDLVGEIDTANIKCDVCGKSKTKRHIVVTKGHKNVCQDCLSVKDYSAKNNSVARKATHAGWTFGFEFECVPRSKEKYGDLMVRYGFIPTADNSLPRGGIEFKSPIINGRTPLRKMFKYAEHRVDFSSDKCGQHINIGNSIWMNGDAMKEINLWKVELFQPLCNYMVEHKEDTIRVCGRYFNYHCSKDGFAHGYWLDISHKNRIEFRISKFVNAEQYFNLTNMWVDMLDTVNKKFIKNVVNKNVSDTARLKYAKSASDEIVNIFKRYAENSKNL